MNHHIGFFFIVIHNLKLIVILLYTVTYNFRLSIDNPVDADVPFNANMHSYRHNQFQIQFWTIFYLLIIIPYQLTS